MDYLKSVKDLISETKFDLALSELKSVEQKYNLHMEDDISFHYGKIYFYLNKNKLALKYFKIVLHSKNEMIKYYSKYYISLIYLNINKIDMSLKFIPQYCKDKQEYTSLIDKIFTSIFITLNQYNAEKQYYAILKLYSKIYKYIYCYDNRNKIDLELANAVLELIKEKNTLSQYNESRKIYRHYKKLSNKNMLIDSIINCYTDFIIKAVDFKDYLKLLQDYEKCYKFIFKLKDLKELQIQLFLEMVIKIIQFYNQQADYKRAAGLYIKYHRFISDGNLFLKNKFLSEYEISNKRVILKSKPRRLFIALSNLCDLKCIMCFEERKKIEHISKKTLNIIVDNLQYVERITWQGGEPFFLPYFEDLLKETCKYERIHQIINSNFQRIKPDIFKLLVKNNINLTVSIDSVKKETYEAIRVGGSFERLLNNIKILNETEKELNRPLFKNINFVVMKENLNELIDIFEFAKNNNFRQLSFLGNSGQKLSKSEQQHIIRQFNFVLQESKKYNINIDNRLYYDKIAYDIDSEISCDNTKKTVTDILTPEQKDIIKTNVIKQEKDNAILGIVKDNGPIFCHLPWLELTLQYDDTLQPHCICKKKHQIVMQETKDINSIWNSELMQQYRKNMINSNISFCSEQCIIQHEIRNIDYHKPISS